MNIDEILKRRALRRYQRNCRGGQRSPTDEYEDAAIIVAWAEGSISEGIAAKALDLSRVEARELKISLQDFGSLLARRITKRPNPDNE